MVSQPDVVDKGMMAATLLPVGKIQVFEIKQVYRDIVSLTFLFHLLGHTNVV